MNNSWIIAQRELKERIKSPSFWAMAIIGPIVVLSLSYLLFAIGGKNKAHWNVLITDPSAILSNKMLPTADQTVTYTFMPDYVGIEEFAKAQRFQKFDAMLEVNEKVLTNKSAFLFYRDKPSVTMASKVQYQFERRLEEVLLVQFTDLSLSDFKKIKQPISIGFRNVYDPTDQATNLGSWVGYFFGAVILLFIFLFGMTILRSTSREKSNRIVEILLATVKPRQLMLGKIIGIGISALIQFVFWVLFIALGLYIMREFLFPNLLSASNINFSQMTEEVKNSGFAQQMFSAKDYNDFVELIYERIQYSSMLVYFVLFFIAGYLFYGSFFSALGAVTGSESDGQQFVLPIVIIMLFSFYAGYDALINPAGQLTGWTAYLPFTSPVVCMVKLAQGYAPGTGYLLIVSLITLLLSAFLLLIMAGRLYKNGILQFGHRLRLKDIIQWSKKS